MTRTFARALAAIGLAAALVGAACSKAKKGAASGCVDVGGAACQACMDGAQAPFCKAEYIAPRASSGVTVNGRNGCCGFDDPKLRAHCESLLRCIRSKGCARGNDPTACYCGDADPMSCARGLKPANGPCADVYAAALPGGPPGTVVSLHGDPRSPIGVASNTFTCNVDASCRCDQK